MLYKIKPWQVVKAVYDMCWPVGMGRLQYTPGPMTEGQAVAFAARYLREDNTGFISMDYVGGRQCKFDFEVTEHGCEIYEEAWFDHTASDLKYLLEQLKALEAEQSGSL